MMQPMRLPTVGTSYRAYLSGSSALLCAGLDALFTGVYGSC